jgi:hypothetical protein
MRKVKMSEFTKEDIGIILGALNFFLKNQDNALDASGKIVPVAIKVQNLLREEKEEKASE